MFEQDWKQFTMNTYVEADVEKVFSLWLTPAGLESWFLKQTIFTSEDNERRKADEEIEPGDTYRWSWYGFNEITESGVIIDCNFQDEISFTFTDGTVVSVHCTSRGENGEHCLINLVQEKIPFSKDPEENLYVQCSIGWTFYLANLKSIAEGGIDLRNVNNRETHLK